MKPILSSQDLAWRLGIPLPKLLKVARQINKHYREWSTIDHQKGKARNFKVPDTELKQIQQRILRKVLADFQLPVGAHGGVKGRSPRTNAERHLGKSLVVNIDIRDFFPSVDHRQVAKMFHREFGCGRQTTWLLTRLTTVNGQLPQGAPTSTMVANILLAGPVDVPTNQRATEDDIEFTRFVDDITLSGARADSLVNETAKSVSRIGLRTWRKRKKLKITPRSRRQEVTGLTVNSTTGPSIPRYKRARIKAAIHQLAAVSSKDHKQSLASIKGRLTYLGQFNPGSAKRLDRHLVRVLKGCDAGWSRFLSRNLVDITEVVTDSSKSVGVDTIAPSVPLEIKDS